jgi:hypothetical protein
VYLAKNDKQGQAEKSQNYPPRRRTITQTVLYTVTMRENISARIKANAIGRKPGVFRD